jgi:tripartite-type tricarboxylate transporter receptor subunit TctC
MTPVTISRRKLLIASGLSLLGVPAWGQDKYPSKAIRMVVPHPVGGGVDIIARNLGEHMRAALGQPIVVENKPGANGMIGAQFTATAPADGYTLMMNGPGEIAIAPHLVKNMTYDPFRDLQPVTLCSRAPNVLVAGPSTPASNVAELIALAKAKPLTFGSSGIGNIQHLNGELFNKLAGVKIEHVPYKGAAPQIADIVAGQINIGYMSVAAAISLIRAGRLRPLAVTSRERVPALPDVPALAETPALASYELNNWFGMFAPAGVPRPILQTVHAAATKGLATPEMRKSIVDGGAIPAPSTPEEFAAFIAGESKMFAQIIKEANVTAS